MTKEDEVIEGVSKKRWNRAQIAEREHECHSTTPKNSTHITDLFKSNNNGNTYRKSKNIVAVGAGMGMIHNIAGVDTAIAIDPIYSDKRPRSSQASIITGMGEHIPVRSEFIDYVICHNVLDHVMNPILVLEEIKRILKPGGEVFLRINIFHIPTFITPLADYLDTEHPHHFTKQTILNLVSQSGLKITKSVVESHELPYTSVKSLVAEKAFRMKDMKIWATKQ